MPDRSLAHILSSHAAVRGDQPAFRFLGGDGAPTAARSYAQLEARASAVATALRSTTCLQDRVLLVFPPGLDFVDAYLGCLKAGRIAVPTYPPRGPAGLESLAAIARDAGASVALSAEPLLSVLREAAPECPGLSGLRWLGATELEPGATDDEANASAQEAPLAFLQYTSGSTGAPRGVRVRHANLLHNLAALAQRYHHTADARCVSWLPQYHDMGLIGCVLLSVYAGASATLMSPLDFIARPLTWLRALSASGGTSTACPNFAFEHCVNRTTPNQRRALDLSRWRFALNGAEPVRADTLARFAEAFAPSGLRPEALHPCYGLAEATLLVTGRVGSGGPAVRWFDGAALEQREVVEREGAGARALVGCGEGLADQRLVIVDPESHRLCGPGQVGEVWLSGPSVADGYWEKPAASAQTFGATLADSGEGPFLRTGDLGFLRQRELFVVGRLKDVLIVDGRNHAPQDLEATAERSHLAIRPGCVAAFAASTEGPEVIALAIEVDATRLGGGGPASAEELAAQVRTAVRRAVAEAHDVALADVVLLAPGELPKTSSGKLRRHQCRERYARGDWRARGAP